MTFHLADLFSQWYQARRFVICETSGDISTDLRTLYTTARTFSASLGVAIPQRILDDEAETEWLSE